mmetsp:Transcript_31877/g.5763  ORF Transcript_31877/g.5763 Transcript_31877/m.5763 type:complete len:101 (-) Transcript_31877:1550-1852(-)
MRAINMLVTFVLLVLIIMHYVYDIRILKKKGRISATDNIRSTGKLKYLLIELAICIWCCPPYLDSGFKGTMLGGEYEYSWNAVIFCIMLFRVYLIFKLFN